MMTFLDTDRLHFFEQPCSAGGIYPCTLAEIEQKLMCLPAQDLQGLWAVGLVASTRKDCNAYGRYLFCEKPTIHLFSYPASYRFKLMAHTRLSAIERELAVELSYGMEVEQAGSRYFCHWRAEDLRRFMLCHVLFHEVGYHVYYWHRKQQGLAYHPKTVARESEQFAEAYAKRAGRD